MVRMLFTLPQEKVKIVALPNGMYDVTICTNESEETVEQPSGAAEETVSVKMYACDGNCFRTVYELTEEEILADLEKYLDYDAGSEPTQAELAHDNALIDAYTAELMEGGLL